MVEVERHVQLVRDDQEHQVFFVIAPKHGQRDLRCKSTVEEKGTLKLRVNVGTTRFARVSDALREGQALCWVFSQSRSLKQGLALAKTPSATSLKTRSRTFFSRLG